MRDEFAQPVKDLLARRVGMVCSNPRCKKPTSGPNQADSKATNTGVAAHITAASPGGPRYDSALTAAARGAADNGIWLCNGCGTLIDRDPLRFDAQTLRLWKQLAEHVAQVSQELGPQQPTPETLAHDRSIFARSDEVMTEAQLNGVLDWLESDHSYWLAEAGHLADFRHFFKLRGNHYVSTEIGQAVINVSQAFDLLLAFIARHFFCYPNNQSDRLCMQPEISVDRAGSGSPAEMARYEKLSDQLELYVSRARSSYRSYREIVKHSLNT